MPIFIRLPNIIKIGQVKQFIYKSLIIFLNLAIITSTYSGFFVALAKLNKVEAYTSTSGYYDCSTSWPSYYGGEECYIRGAYVSQSGWNSAASCWMTNKIVYATTGQQYNFCDQLHTAELTNHEVIAFVRWNSNGTFVITAIAEAANVYNQPPNQPGMIRPQSGWEMGPRNNGAYAGVTCDTAGTGQGCTVDFVTSSYDPDFYQWIQLQSEVTSMEGGNKNYNQTLTSNNQTYAKTQVLNDGHWNFRARNCDTTGECSGYTSYRSFIVDTTAPTGVTMNSEPEYTSGTQNTVSSIAGSDNLSGGIQYEFQVDDDPTFASPNNSSGWISANNYIFASLNDETTYYYRVRARDRLYNTGNWSSSVSSTQDSISPVVQNVNIDNERISPENIDGQFDNTTISFEWIEKYSDNAKLEVLNSADNVIRTITSPLAIGSTNPITHQFTWDGKDNSNTLVIDGPYTLKLTVTDKAGNTTIDDSKIVIIDNIPADINVSTPVTGSWFSSEDITINGQTEAGIQAWITNNQTSSQTQLTLDSLGLFSHNDTIIPGANSFTLDTQDQVENTKQTDVDYFREDSSPTINSITPDNLHNNKQPTITLNVSDAGYNDGINDYISGIDPNSVFISLTHSSNGEIVLVNNGVNTQPSLGSIQQNCANPGTFGNSTAASCTYSFVFSADLTPDGEYTITAKAKDSAGNSAVDKTQNFELDSNIQSDLASPANGNLFNYSQITLTGTAEKNSQISISLPLGDIDGDGSSDNEIFTISDSASNAARVEISNCRASSDPTIDGIKEICDWSVSDFQLEKDTVNPGNIANQIQIDTIDNIYEYPGTGLNTKSETISVNVNLFAVTLNMNTDISYFSPNGDGNQDGVNFTDISTNGQIGTYTLEIKDSNGDVVKSFSAGGTPPSSIPWDGRDQNGDFVSDGTYTYQLKITTTDNIDFETSPVEIYAATELEDSVVITYPKNDSYSSRGVITVQGQAPQSLVNSQDSDLQVKICIDTISLTGTCDTEYYTTVDSNGFFSTIVMLPRVNDQDEHYLTATALDKYGNETPDSNKVKVTTTSNPPFESIQIIPVLTGTNDPAAYQLILDKLDNGEDITQADIDSLRSVVMRSNVYQGTERVRLSLADHSKLNKLSSTTDWNSLGYITGDNQTNLYKKFEDGTTPYTACNSTTCTWDFYYPVPSDLAGLYEIQFEAKLDQEVENLTAGFTVDGNIPTTPIILDINKKIGTDILNTNYVNGVFYSNSEIIQIKGASDPNASIEVKDNSGNTICTTTASAVGIWSCEADTSAIPAYSNPDSNTYSIPLTTYATMGLNTVASVDDRTVVIDKVTPEILSVTTSSQWRKSGDVIDQSVLANEPMRFALSIDKQDPSDPDQCINSTAKYNLLGLNIPVQLGAFSDLLISSNNLEQANGSFVASGHAVEGRYCTTISISDLAGNTNSQKQIFYIDNTEPNTPSIDTTDWGKYNGISTKQSYIADGRLVPEFVHEEDHVKIKAWSEENTKLEFYVNAKLITTSDLIPGSCVQKLNTDKIADTVNVQDKDICSYEFSYPLTQNGKDYVFQVKSVDRAGNKSIISEDEVVYYDNKSPINPEVTHTRSSSYDPTPGWNYGNKSSITKDLAITLKTHAESLSDLEYSTTGPQSFNNYIFTQTAGNQFKDQTISLGNRKDEADPANCVVMKDTRRTGICQDGNYTVSIKSTDAAGNPSSVTKHIVERDTVKPAKGTLKVIADDTNHKISLKIIGELGATIRINGNDKGAVAQGDSTTLLVVSQTYWEYETKYVWKVEIVDKAGNVGEASYISYTTPIPPVKGTTDCELTEGAKIAYPFEGMYTITSPFGYRKDPFTGKSKFHNGIDFGTPMNTEILSAENGSVVYREDKESLGKYLIIHHQEIGINTIYVHLDKNLVKVGHNVKRGVLIALSGNTGHSTGPHLHFGTRTGGPGTEFDPMNMLGKCQTNDEQVAGNITKRIAVNKMEQFIKNNINYDSEIADDSWNSSYPNKKIKSISNLHGYLDNTVHKWCGVWVQDFGFIRENNEQTGYDGIALINPYDERVYLVKNSTWKEYRSLNGTCSELYSAKGTSGITNSNSTWINNHYTEVIADPNPHTHTGGWVQRFIYGSIYYNDKYKNSFAVIRELDKDYESQGGSSGWLGFPVSDRYTYNGNWCQAFEKGIRCLNTDKTIVTPISDLDEDGLDDKLETQLMKKYSPKLNLDRDEKFLPANIDWVFPGASFTLYNAAKGCSSDYGTIKTQNELSSKIEPYRNEIKDQGAYYSCIDTNKTISSNSLKNHDDYHYYYINIDNSRLEGSSDKNDWEMYTRIYPNSWGGINIQYWYFFPNNNPATTPYGFKHEGDWEHITVELSKENINNGWSMINSKIDNVYIAAHDTNKPGYKYSPNELTFIENTHVNIFIAEGTHASYHTNKMPIEEATFQQGIDWLSWKQGHLVNVGELNSYGKTMQEFISYAGRWGETKKSDIPIIKATNSNSPYTMSFQKEAWEWGEL